MIKSAEENWACLFANGARLDVAHNADDLIGDTTAFNTLANGVLRAKDFLDKGLIDDGRFGTGGGCFIYKVTSSETRNTQGLEVTRRGHVELDARSGSLGSRYAGFRLNQRAETIAAIAAVQRNAIGCDYRGHSWNRYNTLANFREELHSALCGIAIDARVNLKADDAAGAEADVDIRGLLQAAQKEAGRGEKNEAHGDLPDDEDVAQRDAAAWTRKRILPFEGIREHGRDAAHAGTIPKKGPRQR